MSNTEKNETIILDEYRFTNPDHKNNNFWFGEDGHIHVKNISAYWIPELTVAEKIGGTIYTVTGSYEGTETFIRKLERITAKQFAEKQEVFE